MFKPRAVDTHEAMALGVNEAFVLNHFRVWIKSCKSAQTTDGIRNAFMSRRELHKQLPFISEATLWRKVAKLENIGILKAFKGPSKGRRNRTKWYGINEEKLKSCLYHHDTNMEKCLYHGDTNYYIEKGYSSLEKEGGRSSTGAELAGSFPVESGDRKLGKLELEQIHKDLVKSKQEKVLPMKPTKVAEYWRLECSLNYNDMAKMGSPKTKELGQWKHILAVVQVDLAGREKAFLRHTVEEWTSLAQTVNAYDGVTSAPTRPNVGYLLQNLPRAIHWFDDSTGGTEVVQSSKVNISAQEETTKALPTYEEAMAAMKSMGVSNDEHGGTNDSA